MSQFLLSGVLGAYVVASLLLLIYGLNSYLMVGLFLRSRRRCRAAAGRIRACFAARPEGERWPVVTTQLPIYNEQNVAERLLRAVCAFDYPRDRHEIQVLDDSTDETVTLVASFENRSPSS